MSCRRLTLRCRCCRCRSATLGTRSTKNTRARPAGAPREHRAGPSGCQGGKGAQDVKVSGCVRGASREHRAARAHAPGRLTLWRSPRRCSCTVLPRAAGGPNLPAMISLRCMPAPCCRPSLARCAARNQGGCRSLPPQKLTPPPLPRPLSPALRVPPGSRVGTPAYLAPEVIMTTKGKTYDGKVGGARGGGRGRLRGAAWPWSALAEPGRPWACREAFGRQGTGCCGFPGRGSPGRSNMSQSLGTRDFFQRKAKGVGRCPSPSIQRPLPPAPAPPPGGRHLELRGHAVRHAGGRLPL